MLTQACAAGMNFWLCHSADMADERADIAELLDQHLAPRLLLLSSAFPDHLTARLGLRMVL